MMILEITNLSKKFSRTPVLNKLNLSLETGEILTILGRSGCGKSTLLRLITGLEVPDAGEIKIRGETAASSKIFREAQERNIGLVFQDYALFPHMSVRQNITFGLAPNDRKKRNRLVGKADEWAERFDLQDCIHRYPHELSGGQQQRTAVARALISEPALLLLDEAFSNVDTGLKNTLREEIKTTLKDHAISAVFVTHDQKEALMLSDKIAIMNNGAIEQTGDPQSLYRTPRSLSTARALGEVNLLREDENGIYYARPEDIRPASSGTEARITMISYLGDGLSVSAETKTGSLLRFRADKDGSFRKGERIFLTISEHLIPASPARNRRP